MISIKNLVHVLFTTCTVLFFDTYTGEGIHIKMCSSIQVKQILVFIFPVNDNEM